MSPLQSLHTYTAATTFPSPTLSDTHAQTMRRNFSYYGMLKAKCNFLWQNTKLIPTYTHTHTDKVTHTQTLLQQGLKLAKEFVCVCVGAVGKLRLRLQLVIGIGLGHGLGLGFDTCNVVAWRCEADRSKWSFSCFTVCRSAASHISGHLRGSASGQGFASFLAFDERRVASAFGIIAGAAGTKGTGIGLSQATPEHAGRQQKRYTK